jgi:hypothetical protein
VPGFVKTILASAGCCPYHQINGGQPQGGSGGVNKRQVAPIDEGTEKSTVHQMGIDSLDPALVSLRRRRIGDVILGVTLNRSAKRAVRPDLTAACRALSFVLLPPFRRFLAARPVRPEKSIDNCPRGATARSLHLLDDICLNNARPSSIETLRAYQTLCDVNAFVFWGCFVMTSLSVGPAADYWISELLRCCIPRGAAEARQRVWSEVVGISQQTQSKDVPH